MPSKSKKQARLMAAVAHNPKFAKKVGIPQSVGREFNNADKRVQRFADGGKASKVMSLLEYLTSANRGMYSEPVKKPHQLQFNDKTYRDLLERHQWDPLMPEDDWKFLEGYGYGNLWAWKEGSPQIARMDELIRKHGIRPSSAPMIYRGLSVPKDVATSWRPGDTLRSFRPSSSSTSQKIADEFLEDYWGARHGNTDVMLHIQPRKDERLSIPWPMTSQSELVMPSGDAGRLRILDIDGNPDNTRLDIHAETVPHPGFAGGGKAEKVGALAQALQNWRINKLPQEGFFSTLDELIAANPEESMPAYMWPKALQPGKVLTRGGLKFPLKKEELEYSKLGDLAGLGDQRMTRDEVREFVRKNRPDLRQTINNPIATYGGPSMLDEFRIKRGYGGPEDAYPGVTSQVRIEEPQYGPDSSYQSLSHRTGDEPSHYEESITNSPDIGHFPSHFGSDDISWSRTTRHEVPSTRQTLLSPTGQALGAKTEGDTLRLIEEIQSDRHSKAGQRVFKPTDEEAHILGPYLDEKGNPTYHLEDLRNVSDDQLALNPHMHDYQRAVRAAQTAYRRRGYQTPEATRRTTELRADNDQAIGRIKDIDQELQNIREREALDGTNEEESRARLLIERDDVRNRIFANNFKLGELNSTPPDAPFKDPRDYATHEVRKQLLNAARENDRFLGVTSGADQIARYGFEPDSREAVGTSKMYDEVYPSVIDKEAGRYGALPVRDVDTGIRQTFHQKLPTSMQEAGEESFDDFIQSTHNEGEDDAAAMIANLWQDYKSGLDLNRPSNKHHLNRAEYSIKDLQKLINNAPIDPDELANSGYDELYNKHFADAVESLRELHSNWLEQYAPNVTNSGNKTFKAAELTPETLDLIRKVGVPIFSMGALGLSLPRDDTPEQSPGLAEGGPVPTKNRTILDYWNQVADSLGGMNPLWSDTINNPETRNQNPLRRPFATFASQVLTRSPEGEMKFGLHPGLVDELQAMPMLLESAGPVLKAANPMWQLRKFITREEDTPYEAPQWARDAADRSTANHDAARYAMNVPAAHGFADNALDALGEMAGQGPLPGKYVKLLEETPVLRRTLGPALEYLSPTIDPKVGNYLAGTVFGGTVGGIGDKFKEHEDHKLLADTVKEVMDEDRFGPMPTQQEVDDQLLDQQTDEALAELGYGDGDGENKTHYADGGKVEKALSAIKALRGTLSDVSDVNERKAHIDRALRNITAETSMPFDLRSELNTHVTGLSDAASDPVPARRQQRFGDYQNQVLRLLDRAAPLLQERTSSFVDPARQVVSNLPAPAPALDLSKPVAVGTMSDADFEKMLVDSRKKLQGYAGGGTVQTPYTGDYNHYGEGPEHLFLGDRKVDMSGFTPVRQTQPVAGKSSSGNSTMNSLMQLGTLGALGYGLYKNYKNGQQMDAPAGPGNYAMPDFGSPGDLDISTGDMFDQPGDDLYKGTNDYVKGQLSNYADNMPMPTIDGSNVESSLWDKAKQVGSGAMGALGTYLGIKSHDAGSTLSGAGQVANALDFSGTGSALGGAGDLVGGIQQGGVKGGIKAASGATQLANQAGYDTGAVGGALGSALGLYGAYKGLQGVKAAYDTGDVKSGMLSGAQTGASLGSIIPGLGTLAGGVIGGTLGILGTSMSGTSNQDNLNTNAWKQYKDAYKNSDSVDFRKSGFPLSFAYNAAPRDAALKAWTGEKGPSGGMADASEYLYGKLKQSIMDAQDSGKLPMDDAQLAQINGREFFNKEIAPQIWKGGKAPNAETQRLIGDWYDSQFGSGIDSERNPQKYHALDTFVRDNGGGNQYFDEAAARNAGALANQIGWEAANKQLGYS